MNIGAQLRQARESRGLSIAALSSTTRISPRILEAIERNDASVIPPRPYGRGFVSVFAREVGLNADDMVHEFFAQFGGPPAVHPPAPSIAHDVVDPLNWRRWGTLLGAAAVVLVLGLLLTRTGVPAGHDPAAVGTTGDGPPAAAPSAPTGPTRAPQSGDTRHAQTAAALKLISTSDSYDGLADCDLVIEAATEKEEIKRKIFADLCPVLPPESIVASNTSSISITRLAAALRGKP